MSKLDIEAIGDPLEVGTRLHWDQETRSLYYVDVPTSTVYKYNEATGRITSAIVGEEPLAFMFPVEGNKTKFIAALGRKLVFVEWNGESPTVSKVETIVEVECEPSVKDNRFNGGKVDPYGRLWAGTMGPTDDDGNTLPGRGSLYCLSKGVLLKLETGIGISNGLAWDIKTNKMYYIDTLEPCVFCYDYNPQDGSIGNKRKVFELEENNLEGLPDGLTIDENGHLWLAVIYGSSVVQFNPETGKILKNIKMPTEQVTSLAFGGTDLDKLFVTTAQISVNGQKPNYPAGKTFVINNSGSRGLAGDKYKP